MVRQAHNEALIEFEYQRREEAEVLKGVPHRAWILCTKCARLSDLLCYLHNHVCD